MTCQRRPSVAHDQHPFSAPQPRIMHRRAVPLLSIPRERSGLVILSAAGAKDLLSVAAGACAGVNDLLLSAASAKDLLLPAQARPSLARPPQAGPSLARVPRARSG
jgi:hypothetical protein